MLNLSRSRILTLIICAILAQSAAGGKTIYVDANATGFNHGGSWWSAYRFLQNALFTAQSGDQIWVAKGVYKPDRGPGITPGDREATFTLKNGVSIYGGFPAGGGTWQSRDPNIYETILSGDLYGNDVEDWLLYYSDTTRTFENSYHVVNASNTDRTAVLDGFTITAGNANGDGDFGRGGGMYSGSPTLVNCTISGNTASEGGGVYNEGSNLFLNNCTISGNTAGGSGGGMYCSSGRLTNCTIRSNTAGISAGACGSPVGPVSMVITNCILWENKPQQILWNAIVKSSHKDWNIKCGQSINMLDRKEL
jgi:hypothetical protein